MKALILSLLLLCGFAYAEETTHEVLPIADTYVTSEAENRNFGGESLLDLKTYYAGTRLLIKFDKNQLKNLLTNKDLVSARLELPIQNHYVKIEGQIGLFKMNVDWTENGATWKCPNDTDTSNYNQDCSTSWLMWSHDPNNTIPYPYDLSPFATGTINADQAVPVGFNIEGYINDLISDNIANNYGFAVYKISTNINDPLAFYSRESDVGPKIILTVKDKIPTSDKVVAKITASMSSGQAPLAVHFDASQSKAKPSSSIQKMELDVGNGYVTLDKINPVYDHTFNSEGEFQGILKVTDASGDYAYDVVSISVLGNENNNLDKNYGYWINFPQNLNTKYSNGQTASLSGDICKIWKTQGKDGSCQWVDKQRLNIKAYFPDMTREVSSLLNVTTNNNKRSFSINTPTLNKNNLNVLTVIVGEIDPTSLQVGALKSKLEMRILLLDQKILDFEEEGVDVAIINALKETKQTLVTLCDRIDQRNAKIPSILAQYNLPLQVDNRVSASRYYSTMVGGFRFELSSDIGNLIQGDFVNIKSRITNINYIPDNTYDLEGYNFKYMYKNALKTTQSRQSFVAGDVHEYIFQDSSRSSLNNFYNFGVEVEEKFKWWSRNLASSEFGMGVIEDTSTPYWVNPQTEMFVGKYLPVFSEKVVDDFGRLDRSSFSVKVKGSVDVDVTDKFTFESSTKGTEYSIKADLREMFDADGLYEVNYKISDFSQKEAIPADYVRKYYIDRRPPLILSPFPEPESTNQPSFELPFTVTDFSPFSFKIYVNGILLEEFNSETGGTLSDSVAVDLVEGINLVKIEGVDIYGHASEINYPPLYLDTTPPSLASINLANGQLVNTQHFTIQGQANELLKSVIINGIELELGEEDTQMFAETVELFVDGPQKVDITLTDLAGNTSDYAITYHFLLKLLNSHLIAAIPAEEEGKVKIIGYAGASVAGLEISAEDGFFNNDETTAGEDGSFELILDTFTYAKVSAYDPNRDRSESAIVQIKNDTTLAGNVRDTDNNPLAGVTIRIVSSGQTAVTDASGTFAIPNPALGDQTITVDGRTISPDITNGEKEFSVITMNVSLGGEQKNIIERTIYLAPKYLDGTETQVVAGTGVTVSSPHAEGVLLEIPASAATFPGGSKNGTINIIEIPASKTSVEVLEAAEPEKVYALEPSGLKFNQPVKLTLPNNNDFPVGTEMVILSKNSTTGNWEIDGAAKVTDGNVIETKDGMGITHFSDVYAAPLGMEIAAFRDGDKPSVDTMSGAVSTSVSLPSFKVMGSDVSPTLVYNSQWANPNIVISNVFDLPRKYFEMSGSISQGSWGGKVKATQTIQEWIVPDHIDAQFFANNVTSEKIRFTGMPDKSLISYQMDLGELPSGIHPAKSSYEIRFNHITIRTQKIKSKDLFGKTKTKTQSWRDEKLLEEIYPQDLVTTIYHQNKKNSEVGSGWRLGIGKKILNPQQDRVMVEFEDGKVATYSVKNTVETIQYDQAGIRSFTTDGNNVFSVNNNGEILRSTKLSDTQTVTTLPTYQGKFGVNTSWYSHWTRRCTKSGFSGCKKREYSYYFACNKYDVDYNFQRKVKSMMFKNGQLVYLDQLGAVWGTADSQYPIAGYYDTPASYTDASNAGAEQDYQTECQKLGKENCSTVRNDFNNYMIKVVEGPTNNLGWCNQPSYCYSGNCTNSWKGSSGRVPLFGYQDGGLGYAKFNQPISISDGPLPDSLLVADYGNNRVRLVDTISGNVSTFAGNNKEKVDNGDNGPATSAAIYHPRGVILLDDSSVLISTENGFIRRVTTDGKISHYAGKPTSQGGVLTDIIDMKNVALSSPSGMALDKDKNYLYLADTGHNRILRIDLTTEEARVVAGSGTCSADDVLDGKAALDVSLCRPEQIALDTHGNLLVLDEANKRVRRINFSTPEDGLIRYAPLAQDNTQLFRNDQGQFILSTREGRETLFSAQGLELQTSDRAGRTTSYQWDETGRLRSSVFPTGQTIDITYSGDHIRSFKDTSGRITQFNYAGNTLSSIDFPDGTERSFIYNEKDVLIEDTNQRGISTKYILNNWGRLARVTAEGSGISISDAVSQTISNDNVNGNSSELKSFGSGNDELKDMISDSKGNTVTFLKDINGFTQEIVDASGAITKVERDSQGRPTKILRPDSSYSEFTYNSFGDLTKRYESESNTSEEYIYNQWGQLTTFKGPAGILKSNVYDSHTGFLLSETDANNNSIIKSYNSLGLIQSVTNSISQNQNYEYDSSGNLIKVIYPMGEAVSYARDESGNVLSKINAKGQKIEYSYDLFNRLTSTKSPGNNITSYSYLPTGELSEIINPKGHATRFEYDVLGRLIKKVSPLGQVNQFAYDTNGNVVQKIDPKGQTTSLEYNNLNQLITKTLPDNVYQYSYTNSGKVRSVSDNDSHFEFNYTKIHGEEFLSSEIHEVLDIPEHTLYHTLNVMGDRIKLDSFVSSINYSRGSVGEILSVKNDKNEIFGFDYDNAYRLTGINRAGVISTSFTHDANSFLNSMVSKRISGQAILNSFTYQKDNIQNKTSMTTLNGVHNYQYDNENQLISASHPEADQFSSLEAFTYDSLGNRLTDQEGTFFYDQKSYRLEEDYKYLYAYDLNGNLVTRQEKGMTGNLVNLNYSSENQLIGVEVVENGMSVRSVEYAYDALGRRTQKKINENSSLKIRKYIYDGNEILAELDGNNSVLVRYTHSGLRTDDVLAMDVTNSGVNAGIAPSTGTYHFLKDGLGSVIDIADANGNVIQHYVYGSYGKILKITSGGVESTSNPLIKSSFAFTGREYDSESGFYHYRARAYDSHSGRFIQEDPHPGYLDQASTFNSAYIYALNNPINRVDPSGNMSLWKTITISLTAAWAGAWAGGAAGGAIGGPWGAVIGAVVGAVVGAITAVAVNGLWNVAEGKDFFKDWQQAAIIGAISGGIAGFKAGWGEGVTQTGASGSATKFSSACGNSTIAFWGAAAKFLLRSVLKKSIEKALFPGLDGGDDERQGNPPKPSCDPTMQSCPAAGEEAVGGNELAAAC